VVARLFGIGLCVILQRCKILSILILGVALRPLRHHFDQPTKIGVFNVSWSDSIRSSGGSAHGTAWAGCGNILDCGQRCIGAQRLQQRPWRIRTELND